MTGIVNERVYITITGDDRSSRVAHFHLRNINYVESAPRRLRSLAQPPHYTALPHLHTHEWTSLRHTTRIINPSLIPVTADALGVQLMNIHSIPFFDTYFGH